MTPAQHLAEAVRCMGRYQSETAATGVWGAGHCHYRMAQRHMHRAIGLEDSGDYRAMGPKTSRRAEALARQIELLDDLMAALLGEPPRGSDDSRIGGEVAA